MLMIMISMSILDPLVNSQINTIIIENRSNLTIKDLHIVDGNITVINSKNIIIKDNIISDSPYYGIFVYNSSNITIIHNAIFSSYYDGINIKNSSYIKIQDNIIAQNGQDGITIWYYSHNISVINNDINQNKYGLGIFGSYYIFIYNNVVRYSSIYGIYLWNASYIMIRDNIIPKNDVAINIDRGNGIYITNDTISNNSIGIYIGEGVAIVNIINNLFYNNSYYGILIYYLPISYHILGNIFYINKENIFYAFNASFNTYVPILSSVNTITENNINNIIYMEKLLIIISISSIVIILILMKLRNKKE